MKPIRLCLASLALFIAALSPTHAQSREGGIVRLVVPFAPGGSTDMVSRILAEKAGAILGMTLLVENKPGASGDLGSAFVARSDPDGTVLLLNGTGPLSIGAASGRELSFDPFKDLTPIGIVAEVPNVVVVNPSLPIHSIKELIAYAKNNPGTLNYGMSAIGNLSQFNAEMFAAEAGIKLLGVPYKGSAPMLTDLLSNRIHLAFDNMPPFLPRIQNGDLRALAVTSSRRSSLLPNVPTLIEEGFPGMDTPARFAIYGPAGLPDEMVQRYNKAFAQAVQDPDVAKRLEAASVVPAPGSPRELAERLRSEYEMFSEVIKSAGLKFQ